MKDFKAEVDRLVWEYIEELEEEIRKLKEAAKLYREDNKKLRAENEYLHRLLPEADWYIIEKQMGKRLWNDWEEDVYE